MTAMAILMPPLGLIAKQSEYDSVLRVRQNLSEREEIAAWGLYLRWSSNIEPKCKFSKGVANEHERQRRYGLFSMFRYFAFRSQHPEVQQMFQQTIGAVSLQWMALCAGTDVPAFYYEWARNILPKSLKGIGKKTFQILSSSPEHVEIFRKIAGKTADKWIVEEVMGE